MKTVLVIDDMWGVAEEIQYLFSTTKADELDVLSSDAVTSYEDAIELIEKHKPDVIALDMSLTDGGEEGAAIAAYLHKSSYAGLVIMISSRDKKDLVRLVGGLGITHYAGSKNPDKLYECISGKCSCTTRS